MRIEYVGKKPVKEDNVAKTGTVWQGQGDVQEVADEAACSKLLAHPLVWRAAAEDAQATNRKQAKAKRAAAEDAPEGDKAAE